MSLITDFNQKPGGKALGFMKEAGGLTGTANTLKDIKSIADTVNGIVGSLDRLVGRFKPAEQSQGSTTSPLQQEQAMNEVQEKKPGPDQAPGAPDNKSIEQFFSTPAGMAKIVDAIDQFTPLIGDVKLSEVKGFLQEFQKKPKQEKKK